MNNKETKTRFFWVFLRQRVCGWVGGKQKERERISRRLMLSVEPIMGFGLTTLSP